MKSKNFGKWIGSHGTLCAALLGVLLAAACCIYITIVGKRYSFQQDLSEEGTVFARVSDDSEGSVEIEEAHREGDKLCLTVRSVSPGRLFVESLYTESGEYANLSVLYVHRNGVITDDDYFGNCTGMSVVHIVICVYIAVWLLVFIGKLRRSLRENLYRYRNILYYGMVIFLALALLIELFFMKNNFGIVGEIDCILRLSRTLTLVTLPLVVITAILVTVSNVKLIRREGRTWRNMLAFFLGILLSVLVILPEIITFFMQTSSTIDVHNWKGFGRFAEYFLESTSSMFTMYLECVLAGTIIVGIKAARRIPSFDKDFIVIHGSMIRKDGTLTKLLQSRADRALEFAAMQKEATGRDIIFVPSGGKGSDEVIAEAEAIRRYLNEKGVPDDRILVEDRSTNTEENLEFSAKLIREREDGADAKIAFSTTNYHVFRAGLLATAQGLSLEGIGSRTKRYFWINAFVREFIATLYAERKRHLLVLGALLAIIIAGLAMVYVSNVILS